MFPGVRTQTRTKMFSVFYEMSLSTAAASRLSQQPVPCTRGAATEKALSPIRRHVRGMTRLPHDEARSADRAGTSATGVSKSEM